MILYTKTLGEELPSAGRKFLLFSDDYVLRCESVNPTKYGNYEITISYTTSGSRLSCYRDESAKWCYLDEMSQFYEE